MPPRERRRRGGSTIIAAGDAIGVTSEATAHTCPPRRGVRANRRRPADGGPAAWPATAATPIATGRLAAPSASAALAAEAGLGWMIVTDAPIGIFDSGVGGLTVARAVSTSSPTRRSSTSATLARSPYGPKPIADVRRYALDVLDDLVAQGVKMLVIACNTASSAMLRDARERYDVPVVEVIQPAVRRRVDTRTGRVGVIGTAGTIQSRAYDGPASRPRRTSSCRRRRARASSSSSRPASPPAPRCSPSPRSTSRRCAPRVDTLVLGCTHYPFLTGAISYVMGDGVSLVSSDVETANDVYRVLVTQGLERRAPSPPVHRFEATGDSTAAFLDLAHRLIGPDIASVELVQTGALTLPHRQETRMSEHRPNRPRARRRPHPSTMRDVVVERGWSTTPRAARSSRSGRPRCCARRASPTACRAGCPARARAGSPPSTRCCPARRTRATTASRSRAASRAHAISRLIGRSLRAVVDTKALGENTIR